MVFFFSGAGRVGLGPTDACGEISGPRSVGPTLQAVQAPRTRTACGRQDEKMMSAHGDPPSWGAPAGPRDLHNIVIPAVPGDGPRPPPPVGRYPAPGVVSDAVHRRLRPLPAAWLTCVQGGGR
jgi:hypothetical protein